MAAATRRPPAPTMVIQDDYIDMDLTAPSSPRCAVLEFEFQSSGGGGGARKEHREEGVFASASPADELFYRGKLLPLHLPPRLQLVQKLLLQEQEEGAAPLGEGAAAGGRGGDVEVGEDGDDAKACAAKKYSWSKRLKLMKRWTSREYIRSLFLAKPLPSDIGVGNGVGGVGGRAAVASVLDQDELCSHRRSFSGIIRRVRLVVSTKAAAPAPLGTSPLCSSSSSSSSSSSTPSCRITDGFFQFHRPRGATPVLKRSSSAGSEEGAIQGAIAHCKRSHHEQQGRRSVGGGGISSVVFYSVNNTPRVSSSVAAAAAAAASEAAQERQEMMCRG